MSRTLRIIVILVVIVGLGVAGYLYFGKARAPKAPDYQIVAAKRDTLMGKIAATGSISPRTQINLNFKGTGRVSEVNVEFGQAVKKGAVLARLSAKELELSLEQAKNALKISQTQYAQTEAGPTAGEIAAAKASLASAKAAYEKTARGPNPEDIASARAGLDSANAALRKLQRGPTAQETTVAKANLEQARIALDQAQAAYDQVSWFGGIGALPQSLNLQKATISYEAAQANYELATQGATESQVKAAQAQVAQAQSSLERLLQSPTASEMALAESQVTQAQANLDRLTNSPTAEQLAIARGQVRQAEIAVEQAQLTLDGASLVAPFDGIVALVNIQRDAFPSAGLPAVVLVDLSEFYVDVSVDEIDVTQINAGQDVILSLDALPGVNINGYVEKVAPTSTNLNGAVSYTVRVTIEKPDARVRAGMTTTVEVITARHENVLTVPNRAISLDRTTGKATVEKLVNGQPVVTEVTVGLRGDSTSEISAGLRDGDQVIVRNISALQRMMAAGNSSGGFGPGGQ
jgi:HlyD family secretion protein